jgi:hypothetical protein
MSRKARQLAAVGKRSAWVFASAKAGLIEAVAHAKASAIAPARPAFHSRFPWHHP